MTLHDVLWTESTHCVPEAVTAAFTILKMTKCEFNSSFFYGCNFGRDADTIGAVVGSICGALHGLSAFPKDWVEKVRYPTGTCLEFTKGIDILDLADQLTELILSE
jgi:ADP-ribosylglycohydrolase